MRKLLRRVLPVVLVATIVGLAAAASSSTTVIQTTAKLVPVKGAEPNPPSTAKGTIVHTITTIEQNYTTFPPVKTLAISVKGLLGKGFADGGQVTFSLAGAPLVTKKVGGLPVTASLSNGSVSVILDTSMGSLVPKAVSGDVFDVFYNGGGTPELTGAFGPSTKTTK